LRRIHKNQNPKRLLFSIYVRCHLTVAYLRRASPRDYKSFPVYTRAGEHVGEAPSAPTGARSANTLLNDGAFMIILYQSTTNNHSLSRAGMEEAHTLEYYGDSAACDLTNMIIRTINNRSPRRRRTTLKEEQAADVIEKAKKDIEAPLGFRRIHRTRILRSFHFSLYLRCHLTRCV
jgi:hypothetical protein